MPIPVAPESQWFEPQELRRLFAAGEAIFLVDAARLQEFRGDSDRPLLNDLLPGAARGARWYAEGAIVPAFGVERGFYTVLVRSTETEGAMTPLSHIAFSTGFVLGTETGELLVANAERLENWQSEGARIVLDGQDAGERRGVRVAPGWYGVTVVAGIRDNDESGDEEWVVCFLLEPQAEQPEFFADTKKSLNVFG
ncbi:hypothetical protein SAMN05421770_107235 [Granulicella rosea]|uniref:Uncharacterized protein n=1 Tax=Granulicella rosea TaxID=474952 RepID=A0A239LTQ8_9BACT|nr:hypothetical protein [Granulicella rosea]SNT33089.1 hypothetical protein SAMN05421770_107235 [Granulicella rosea]